MRNEAIDLSERPERLAGASVAAWQASIVLPTYLPEVPDRYPAFLDRRVYQGSSGRVYPLPFTDRISEHRQDRSWVGLHLENEFLRVLILPELGGRIHLAIDRRTGYPMFYANPVLKPALVGLAGAWVAGGVELNWPQHHRPATFLPTAWSIEERSEPDNGCDDLTVWCSDHDPFARMKGMHGVRLRAGSTVLELRVRLFNRSEEPQSFLWWANVAAEVHADYQSFFPPDVHLVADHAKRAVATFPAATAPYYGIDYRARRPQDTRPDSALKVPGDRLDWYRNIPVPTSYMAVGSQGDFFGGYDHRAHAGFVHWADHHYAVGKKQWSWGDAPFGHTWNRNLTDDNSAYVELMAGVYTENQPDFSHLAPGETKTFSQFWYPVAETGPVVQATLEAALGVEADGQTTAIHLDVTSDLPRSTLAVRDAGTKMLLHSVTADLTPRHRFAQYVSATAPIEVALEQAGREVLSWTSVSPSDDSSSASGPATEPPAPGQVASVEELYLIGRHLQQYRHATRSPEPYWQEALRRDPGHSASHTALGARRYRAGLFADAEHHLRIAIARLTALNPNPTEGDAHYWLGLTLARTGQAEKAYAAFAKATWLAAWVAPGRLQMAVLDARAGRNQAALKSVNAVLQADPQQVQARNLWVVLLRRMGGAAEADAVLAATLALDPLDTWALQLAGRMDSAQGQTEAQTLIDVALENARIGEYQVAAQLFALARTHDAVRPLGQTGCGVLADYHLAAMLDELGDPAGAEQTRRRARGSDRTWNFPGRLDDVAALQSALAADPEDPTAMALLGHWFYAHERPYQALDSWRRSLAADPSDPVVWRNLAVGTFNHSTDTEAAVAAYDQAIGCAPRDARLWYESDQLLKRIGAAMSLRLGRLDDAPVRVADRDDLSVEYAHLLVSADRAPQAIRILQERTFQPWEGGEGQVLRAWERTQLALANRALHHADPYAAVEHASRALAPPASLGEGRHPLANPAQLWLTLGVAHERTGNEEQASQCWRRAAHAVGDFAGMVPRAHSENTYYSVLAARKLGEDELATSLMEGLASYIEELATTPAMIDYFATSIPELLLFDEDPERRRKLSVHVLRAQFNLLIGDRDAARTHLAEVLQTDPAFDLALDLNSSLEPRESRT